MNTTTIERLSPAEVARRLNHGRGFIMKLIDARELAARDERSPGAKLPRYTVSADECERWLAKRMVVGEAPIPVPRTAAIVVTGLLSRRREARRIRRASALARG